MRRKYSSTMQNTNITGTLMPPLDPFLASNIRDLLAIASLESRGTDDLERSGTNRPRRCKSQLPGLRDQARNMFTSALLQLTGLGR